MYIHISGSQEIYNTNSLAGIFTSASLESNIVCDYADHTMYITSSKLDWYNEINEKLERGEYYIRLIP